MDDILRDDVFTTGSKLLVDVSRVEPEVLWVNVLEDGKPELIWQRWYHDA